MANLKARLLRDQQKWRNGKYLLHAVIVIAVISSVQNLLPVTPFFTSPGQLNFQISAWGFDYKKRIAQAMQTPSTPTVNAAILGEAPNPISAPVAYAPQPHLLPPAVAGANPYMYQYAQQPAVNYRQGIPNSGQPSNFIANYAARSVGQVAGSAPLYNHGSGYVNPGQPIPNIDMQQQLKWRGVRSVNQAPSRLSGYVQYQPPRPALRERQQQQQIYVQAPPPLPVMGNPQ